MREFFKPWRRKVGVLTLLMACAATGGWVRSLRRVDNTAFAMSDRSLIQLISRAEIVAVRRPQSQWPVQEISVDRVLLRGFQAPQGNSTGNLAINVDAKARAAEGSPFRWTMKSDGFEIGGCSDRTFPLQVFIVSVPYWSIVLPLTLLSAWLLLSKPRTANRPQSAAPGVGAT